MDQYAAAMIVCWKLGMLGNDFPVCMAAFGFPNVEVNGQPLVLRGYFRRRGRMAA